MKWTTFVPTHRNDGSPVSEAEMQEIMQMVFIEFGGATRETGILGDWIDPADRTHYHDRSIKLSVVCERSKLPVAEEMVRTIGRKLNQEAMYFEVQYADGVEFLK